MQMDRPAMQEMSALDELLDDERDALLSGDLAKIARLIDLKEKLVSELNVSDDLDPIALKGLRHKIAQNQDLFVSARAGLTAVSKRLELMKRVRTTLETYDHKGRKTAVDMGKTRKMERRS